MRKYQILEYINDGNLSKVALAVPIIDSNQQVIIKQPIYGKYYKKEKQALAYLNKNCNLFPELLEFSDDNSILVLEYLGKKKNLDVFDEKIFNNLNIIHKIPIPNFVDTLYNSFINKSIDRILYTDRGKDLILINNLKQIIKIKYNELRQKCLKKEPEVLLHGDLWNGNIFNDKFIDPILCYGSRYFELAYFISDVCSIKELNVNRIELEKFISKKMNLDLDLLIECEEIFDLIYGQVLLIK